MAANVLSMWVFHGIVAAWRLWLRTGQDDGRRLKCPSTREPTSETTNEVQATARAQKMDREPDTAKVSHPGRAGGPKRYKDSI